MPRKCIMCGASQSISLSVFSFPRSQCERAAWISRVQEVIPGYSDPQNVDVVTGPRSGICEKHFLPQDIKKGKTSSLIKKAVPVQINRYEEEKPTKSRVTFVKESLTEHKEYENTWRVNGKELKSSNNSNCLDDNLDSYFPDDNSCIESKSVCEYPVGPNEADIVREDMCLVCGRSDKNLILLCNLQVHSESNTTTSVSLLSRIVGKPKREILVVSLKICTICVNLVQEVSHLEENLKIKKVTIKDMFESTLKAYKERSKVLSSASRSLSVPTLDINYNATQCSTKVEDSTNLSGDLSPGQARPSSRRQLSSKKYYCSSCKEMYPSLALWVQHCSKHTDNDDSKFINRLQKSYRVKKKRKLGIYNCDECDKTFYSRQSLVAHAPAHQKGSECNICGRYLSSKARLKAHLFKMHEIGEEKNKEYECGDCGKCFSTKAGLRYHRNVIHHVGTKYVCGQCNKIFYYHVPYRSHLLYAHGEKKVICETCGEKFFTGAKLNAHINAVHRSAKSWACKECKSKFTTHTSYRHHMNVKHLKIQHTCDYCDANFRKKSSLIVHLWKHSVFKCQLCRESFSRTEDLRSHMSGTHGKEINFKGKKKQSSQIVQKRRDEPALQPKAAQEEPVQQNEHVTSIVINDLLITAESYDNSALQPFSLSACEKLPEKPGYSSGEELKVETMDIIDTAADLQSVDPVQFDAVESLQMKASHDHIGVTPGVSLINVQILGDMEISQSDTLGDLKTSMLDATDHMSHDGQLDNEDNITDRLTVETHHLTADELSVGNDLDTASHTLDHTDHLEPPCHLEVTSPLSATSHLEVTHQLDASHDLQVETGSHLEVTRHLETEDPMHRANNLKGADSLDSGCRETNDRSLESSECLKTTEHLEPKDHLHISSHIGDSALNTKDHLHISSHIGDSALNTKDHLHISSHIGDSTLNTTGHLEVDSTLSTTSHLEVADKCSLPSMMSQIDSQVTEQIVSHISPHMHDIASDVDTEIATHIGSGIHDITSEVRSQIVDHVNEHIATQIHSQMDHISADVQVVGDDMVAQIGPEISSIGNDVNTQIVDHVETPINADIDPHMVQQDAVIVDQSLDKQLEKMDSVELEPFSVTLDQKDMQYQYVMYISAPGEDSNPD